MSAEEIAAWGRSEWAARKTDLASMHAGHLSLPEVQDRAKRRRRAVGLSMSAASRALPSPRDRG